MSAMPGGRSRFEGITEEISDAAKEGRSAASRNQTPCTALLGRFRQRAEQSTGNELRITDGHVGMHFYP